MQPFTLLGSGEGALILANLPQRNIFFQFLSTALRKLSASDKKQEIFRIKKQKIIFLIFF
jgi:hypothetical protein